MKTNDVEKELGISRHTIRYYEKEGLFTPLRNDNDYRNYTDQNIQTLKVIKFLRSLEISLDDIKLILNGKLDFQECLKINQIHLEKQQENITEMRKMIDFYREKNIPLIPGLEDIYSQTSQGKFGYQKTTKTVSLGRTLTQSFAIRQVIYAFIFILAMEYGFVRFLPPIIQIIFLIFTFFLFIGFSSKQSSYTMLDNSMNQSVEFLSDGIRYYQFTGFLSNLKYFFASLLNKGAAIMCYYTYEQIKQVEVIVHHRYMKIASPLAFDMYVADFYFKFKDGNSFYFFWPMILDDDARFIARILESKIEYVIDKDKALYAMKNGINLNDYYLNKNTSSK